MLAYLTDTKTPWAIATSARIDSARPTLEKLGVPPQVPVITEVEILPLEMRCHMDDFGIITPTDRLLSPGALLVVDAIRDVSASMYGEPGLA